MYDVPRASNKQVDWCVCNVGSAIPAAWSAGLALSSDFKLHLQMQGSSHRFFRGPSIRAHAVPRSGGHAKVMDGFIFGERAGWVHVK
jgi:hypothetical protein